MKNIKLVQLDGKLPNLALMRLAHWHSSQGDSVRLTRSVQPTLFDQEGIDIVYGSAIFTYSLPKVKELQVVYPEVIMGGTGSEEDLALTVEQILGVEEYEHHDYSIYPEYPWSIGFTQRGCRLNCGFCVVPKKEGKPRSVNTIGDIWRPETQRNIVLLDNDFFGQDEHSGRQGYPNSGRENSRSTSTRESTSGPSRTPPPPPSPRSATTTTSSRSAGSTPPGITWGRNGSSSGVSTAWRKPECPPST